ncbi:MAG: DUF1573 domain-containing protein [Nitrospirae bacterium]|nr:MAG: DUF1573 domain-containing protein [Nitrospirota bacterium]
MKIWIVLALCLVFLPAVLHAQPVVSFTELSYNFGTVGQAEKAEHLFEFVNKGDQELIIEKVSSS